MEMATGLWLGNVGLTLSAGGTGVTVLSGGVAAPVGVPVTAVGVSIATAGGILVIKGASDLKKPETSHSSNSRNPMDTGRWNKGSFGSPEKSLEYHFKKHGQDVKAKDAEQYLRKATEFSKDLKGARKKRIQGSTEDVIHYYKNGKYIDISGKSIISFGLQSH